VGVCATAPVRESLSEHLAYLDREVAKTEELIRSHIDSHQGLRAQRDLLLSIPGIGETTAAKLLAEIMDVKLYGSARQLAAFAGLAPRLRKALYFPAIAAVPPTLKIQNKIQCARCCHQPSLSPTRHTI